MSRTLRLLAAAVAALALVATLALGGAQAATPQLRLNLNAGRFLEVITASGTHIRTASAPGTVIPPGTYQAVVSTEVGDADDTHHMFHLSGPGQNLQTDLLGGDSPTEIFTITLLPSSTYTFARRPQPGADAGRVQHVGHRDGRRGLGSSSGSQSGSRRHDVEHADLEREQQGQRRLEGAAAARHADRRRRHGRPAQPPAQRQERWAR